MPERKPDKSQSLAKRQIEQALFVLEARKVNLSEDQLKRLVKLTETDKCVRSDVTDTLKPVVEAAEKRELTPEQADRLISTLKSRFEEPYNEELRKAIDFADVEKSLRADPEAMFPLQKLEDTGGEPHVIGIDGDEFIFEDRSAESPPGRRNRDFDEADGQRKEFGPNVKFQSPDSYKAMQKTGNFDLNSWSWLETDAKTREAGGALRGNRGGGGVHVSVNLAGDRGPDGGWRASLRVKKA